MALGIGNNAVGAFASAIGIGNNAIGFAASANFSAFSSANGAFASSDFSAFSTSTGAFANTNLSIGSTATGAGADASLSVASTATGAGANASVSIASTATGAGSDATFSIGSTATGAGSSVSGTVGASAYGAGSSANFDNSAAFGAGATATRENEQVFGTASNTYTTPGITSAASRSFQTGPLQLVTTDAQGHLASDQGAVFKGIAKVQAGVAIALALEAPSLTQHENFGLRLGWGNLDGDANAFGMSAMGVLCRGCLGSGTRLALDGGVGFSHSDFLGYRSESVVAGRAGVQLTWK